MVKYSKLFSIVLVAAIIAMLAPAAGAASSVRVLLNGGEMQLKEAPLAVKGTTLVPMRLIFEALQATVTWDGETQTIRAVRGTESVELGLNQPTAVVNGEQVKLEQPAQIVGRSTMVPLRFVSEALRADVKWDGATGTIAITSPGKRQTEEAFAQASTGDTAPLAQLLLTRPDAEQMSEWLQEAVVQNSPAAVELLLQKGAKPSEQSIMEAVTKRKTEVMRLFLENGLSANFTFTIHGQDTLMRASTLSYDIKGTKYRPDQQFTHLLLEHGAIPSADDLNAAIRLGWPETVQKMIDAGADPNSTVASSWGHKDIETQLYTAFTWVLDNGEVGQEVIKLLLKNGANPEPEQARTAASRGFVDIMRIMLENGYDPNNSGEADYSLLYYASNHPEMQALLKEYGAI